MRYRRRGYRTRSRRPFGRRGVYRSRVRRGRSYGRRTRRTAIPRKIGFRL